MAVLPAGLDGLYRVNALYRNRFGFPIIHCGLYAVVGILAESIWPGAQACRPIFFGGRRLHCGAYTYIGYIQPHSYAASVEDSAFDATVFGGFLRSLALLAGWAKPVLRYALHKDGIVFRLSHPLAGATCHVRSAGLVDPRAAQRDGQGRAPLAAGNLLRGMDGSFPCPSAESLSV